MTTVQESPKVFAYRLSTGFANSLRQALTGGGNHRSFGVPCSALDKHKVDMAFLDKYAREQWESILYYMVGSTSGLRDGQALGQSVGNGTRKLLELGNFVNVRHGVTITKTGFTFLLQEVNAQVWSLLIVYLKQAPGVSYTTFPHFYRRTKRLTVTFSSECLRLMCSPSFLCLAV